MEAAAKELADACARDLSELAQLREAGQAEAIQALLTHSSCPSMPAAARQAAKEIVALQAKTCADEQKSLAQIDRKDEGLESKVGCAQMPCGARRRVAATGQADEADRLRIEHECADQREPVPRSIFSFRTHETIFPSYLSTRLARLSRPTSRSKRPLLR